MNYSRLPELEKGKEVQDLTYRKEFDDLRRLSKIASNYKTLIKQKSLYSASKIMNQKGFNESNIDEIALEADIKELIMRNMQIKCV